MDHSFGHCILELRQRIHHSESALVGYCEIRSEIVRLLGLLLPCLCVSEGYLEKVDGRN